MHSNRKQEDLFCSTFIQLIMKHGQRINLMHGSKECVASRHYNNFGLCVPTKLRQLHMQLKVYTFLLQPKMQYMQLCICITITMIRNITVSEHLPNKGIMQLYIIIVPTHPPVTMWLQSSDNSYCNYCLQRNVHVLSHCACSCLHFVDKSALLFIFTAIISLYCMHCSNYNGINKLWKMFCVYGQSSTIARHLCHNAGPITSAT